MNLNRMIQGKIENITPKEGKVEFLGVPLPAMLVDYVPAPGDRTEAKQFVFYGEISNPGKLSGKYFVLQETRPDMDKPQIPIKQQISVYKGNKLFRRFRFSRNCE